uniref:Uncharacterized protein n=1 Tax=Octopus bimaculoides TaxID=37653 RepID=A0A0L8HUK3_OCTBM
MFYPDITLSKYLSLALSCASFLLFPFFLALSCPLPILILSIFFWLYLPLSYSLFFSLPSSCPCLTIILWLYLDTLFHYFCHTLFSPPLSLSLPHTISFSCSIMYLSSLFLCLYLATLTVFLSLNHAALSVTFSRSIFFFTLSLSHAHTQVYTRVHKHAHTTTIVVSLLSCPPHTDVCSLATLKPLHRFLVPNCLKSEKKA